MKSERGRDYYLSLSYPIEIIPLKPEEGGGFSACIPLLGRYACTGDGETVQEAVDNLNIIKANLIDSMLAKDLDIPEPVEQKAAIKAFQLRMPVELYRQIVDSAYSSGISINRFILDVLLSRQRNIDLDQAINSIRAETRYVHQLLVWKICQLMGQPQKTSNELIELEYFQRAPVSTDTGNILYTAFQRQIGPQFQQQWFDTVLKGQGEKEDT